MNDLTQVNDCFERSAELAEIENEQMEFNDGEEEFNDELCQLELQWKALTSTRRFKVRFRIPFFKTYIFSAAIRPFIEGWDDQIAEPFEAPPEEAFQHDPMQHH
jgi:hypothetical protein